MAMIACPECTTEVSDAALKCPKCGVQLVWMLYGFFVTGSVASEATSDAERIGTGIGAMAGLGLVSCVWVIGDIILGLTVLLTRPKS